jgi:hypothetical protein
MNDKLINHIKRKLHDKGEVLDHFDEPTDEQIKCLMITTFEIVENECQKCFFCKNYKRFSLGSLCRIKPHIQSNCFHFSLDIHKVLKKKYCKILIVVDDATRGKHITTDRNVSPKARKNVIYESIKLYEILNGYKEIMEV